MKNLTATALPWRLRVAKPFCSRWRYARPASSKRDTSPSTSAAGSKAYAAREFRLLTHRLDRHVHNWAHTDGVSSWLLAACIANDDALMTKLPAWTESKNRWKRRASAVALLQEAKHGRNTEAIFDTATRLHRDQDDMVRKGVGWLLKETYPKKPKETVAFVKSLPFPRLVIRYAAEKMTPKDKAAVMAREHK